MKKYSIIPILLAISGLILSGCTNTNPDNQGGQGSEPVDPTPTPSEKSFDDLKNGIVNDHNYSIDIDSYYVNHREESYIGQMFNLNNETYFGNDPEYYNLFYKGYTKVKDQGIAEFTLGLNSTDVVLGDFVCTNPNLGIYDIHGGLIEYIFESELIKVEDDHYKVTNQDLVGIVGTFSGLELSYISNPDHIDIYKINETIKIDCTLTANYYDPQTLSPVQNEPVYVGLTIKNIGSTSNPILDNFSKDASKKAPTPTSWDDEISDDFQEHYNGYVPPFVNGLSYSFHHSTDWNGYAQKYEIKGQDFASGDLRYNYSALLVSNGFALNSNNIYEKVVSNSEHTLDQIYCVEMNFISPSTPYGSTGKTYGYYYVNGVFQITYYTYSKVTVDVDTVSKLNNYLATTDAASIIPTFPAAFNSNAVTGFKDATEISNQLYGGGYLFTTSMTSYFTISVSAYSDALTFYNSFATTASSKGFTSVSHNPVTKMVSMSDYANSYIEISDISVIGESNYSGKIQCKIVIRDDYTVYYSVDVSGDAGISSTTIISPSNYMKVEAGTKVTFSFVIAGGYELDEITCNVTGVTFTKESGENTYSFIMPEHNVSVSITSKSSAADEGLVYEREYVTYRDNNNVDYDTAPSVAHSRLVFVFHEDGTGSYSRTTYNSSGAVTGGPYVMTFNYSLVDGQFKMSYLSGTITAFSKWRLFNGDSTDAKNNTGTFDKANNQLTITLVDSSENETIATFK